MAHLDLVADILQRVAEHAHLPNDTLRALEIDVRADWGGERHYVAKVGEVNRAIMDERDRKIRELHANGAPEDYLSLRFDLGVRRIRQIVSSGNALP